MNPKDFTANVARFWGHVNRTDTCWLWTGQANRHGYGRLDFWHDGRRSRVLAHRLSLRLAGVDLADDDVVRHSCDTPPCVRPDHLLVGTQAENIRDAIDRGRADLAGLELGHSPTWPPRPCRRCGVIVSEGRRRYCPPCRKVVSREQQRRYNSKRKASA